MQCLQLVRTIASRITSALPRPVVKWAGWAVVALLPGSLMVIPLIWIARQLRAQTSWR